MKSILPIAASCLLAGGAIGYVFGNNGNEVVEENTAKEKKGNSSGRSRSVSGSSTGGGSAKSRKPMTYEEVAATPGQTARLQALVDLYSGLSGEEFAAEADKIRSLPFNEQILAGSLLFAAWGEESPYEALNHAKTKMGFAANFVKPTILQSWASTDPKGAAAYYTSNKSEFSGMGMMGGMMGRGRGGSSGAGTIAGEWARQDPEGAMAWAKSLEGGESDQAVVKALSQIASTDPARAADLTSGLQGEALAKANTEIASEWAKSNWGEAESFIGGLPADQQGDALGAAVRSLANEDPQLAASKALEIPEGKGREDAIGNVAKSLARENPEDAANWVVKNGGEDAQKGAMRDIMRSWVGEDASAAKTFATSQPEGPVRDAAISSFVINDSNSPPQENIKLAETITDEGSRGMAVGMTTMRWMGEDSEGATKYLESSTVIDEGWKRRIMRQGGGR